MFKMIVATDLQGAIGFKNELLFRSSSDLKRFKELTMGGTVIMGWNTACSIGHALPGRRNIVLTSKPQAPYEGQEVFHDIDSLLAEVKEGWIIGGAQVYNAMAAHCDEFHITEFDAIAPMVDTRLDLNVIISTFVRLTEREEVVDPDGTSYTYSVYTRFKEPGLRKSLDC